MPNSSNHIEALQLLIRAEQFQGAGDLSAAETCLEDALRLDPGNIQVLHAAARFYSGKTPNPEKARRHASDCRERAARIVGEMDEILGQQKQSPPSRRIAGIIGPY